MEKKVIVTFYNTKEKFNVDLEIPLDISANELVLALNDAYHLNIDTSDIKNCFMQSENPIALLKGNKTLFEYGIRQGSKIFFTE